VCRAVPEGPRWRPRGREVPADEAYGAQPLGDEVVQLRVWGSDHAFALLPGAEMIVGTDSACSIRLDAPHARASPRHARLIAVAAQDWTLHDLGSESGIVIDGVRRDKAPLYPDAEIRLGDHAKQVGSSIRAWLAAAGARTSTWGEISHRAF